MSFDRKVPLALKMEQQWFGSIIGRPIDRNSQMNPISPSGQPMEIEAAEHISPSPTLKSEERIQIYNQQYWWRLLNVLHETFPLLTRLFGYVDFNETFGFNFLVKYPPRHWQLTFLGDRLIQWIEEEYHHPDKELILNATKVDWAFNYSFIAEELPPITAKDVSESNQEKILTEKLFLQPHVYLFKMEYELFQYRFDFLKEEPEHWLDNPFPELKRDKLYHFILYRAPSRNISWKEISKGEYCLLKLFQQGSSIENACEWLEQEQEELYQDAMENLQAWFQEWTTRGWLSLQQPIN